MRTFKMLILLAALYHGRASAQRVQRDIPYGADSLQQLDLSIPAGRDYATVIFVHGGSLQTGDKADSDYRHVCDPFPAAGIACASVNYRLGNTDSWPAQPNDVASAIAWVHDHIAERGGDPRKLFLLGHSSGALLVAIMASDTSFLAARHMKASEIRGVMPMGSIMWDDELRQALAQEGRARVTAGFSKSSDSRMFGDLDSYEHLWPMNHIHRGMPPYLFLIAEGETVHPPVLMTDSVFADSSRRAGNVARWVVFPGHTHSSNIRNLAQPHDTVFSVIRDFVLQFH
jgi:Esterase/lipase